MRHQKYLPVCACQQEAGLSLLLASPLPRPSVPFTTCPRLPQFHQSTQPLHHVSYCMFYHSVPVPVTSYQKLGLVSSTQNQETSCL